MKKENQQRAEELLFRKHELKQQIKGIEQVKFIEHSIPNSISFNDYSFKFIKESDFNILSKLFESMLNQELNDIEKELETL